MCLKIQRQLSYSTLLLAAIAVVLYRVTIDQTCNDLTRSTQLKDQATWQQYSVQDK